jgi:hypothetical protein
MATMAADELSSTVALRRLIDGYQVSQALYVVATLGVADQLAAGPRTSDELAAAVGAHPGTLFRVLRALAAIGVFTELDGAWFALTPLGEHLRSDAAEPLGGWARFIGREYHWQAWAHLLDAVRSGECAFMSVHGRSGWEYRSANPDENAIFDRAMTDLSQRICRQIVDAYDFGRHVRIVDVGGGRGALLAAILNRYPSTRGMLFDLPHVVTASHAVLAAAGVSERCDVVAGDFFAGLPDGADAYILKTVLHDWDDADAFRILHSCRRASRQGATLIVVEWELGPRNSARDAKMSDLEMLVGNGGRVRSLDQQSNLLTRSGFHLRQHVRTDSGYSILVGTAV